MASNDKSWTLKKPRKPTAIVKCPHCSHTGSARGLFQHVRLAHNDITAKPATTTIIKAHPLDVRGLGHVKDKVHKLDKKQLSFLDGVVVPLATALFIKLMEEYTLPSKVEKPYSSAIGSIEKPKRKHYGE
jgi:hypothetical protein